MTDEVRTEFFQDLFEQVYSHIGEYSRQRGWKCWPTPSPFGKESDPVIKTITLRLLDSPRRYHLLVMEDATSEFMVEVTTWEVELGVWVAASPARTIRPAFGRKSFHQDTDLKPYVHDLSTREVWQAQAGRI